MSLFDIASDLAGLLGTLVAAGATQVVGTFSVGIAVPVMVGMGVRAASSRLVALAFLAGRDRASRRRVALP